MILGKRGGLWKIIIIFLIILVIGLGVAFVKINSMVGEQLRLSVTPEYLESSVVMNEPNLFEVDVKVNNKFVCEALCNYTLTDISHNDLIDRGYFNVKGFKLEHYSKELPMKYDGYGTNLYLYRLECRSNHSTLCPSTKDVVIRKSLLVLSYEPSGEQLKALSYLDKNYPIISENFVNASKNILLSKMVLDSVNHSFDRQKYLLLEKDRDVLKKDMDSVMDSWINDDYLSAMSLADGSDMLERSIALSSESGKYRDYLYQTVDDHNELLMYISQNYPVLETYADIIAISGELSGMNSSDSASLLNFVLRSNSAVNTINTEDYNYGALYAEILELGEALNKLNPMIIDRTRQGMTESYAPIFVYARMLCATGDESGCGLINSSIKDYVSAVNSSKYNVSDIPSLYEDLCEMASEVYPDIDDYVWTGPIISSQSNGSINGSINSSINISSNISDDSDGALSLLLEYRFLSEYHTLVSNRSDYDSTWVSYHLSKIKDSLDKDYNISNPVTELAKYNSSLEDVDFVIDPKDMLLSELKSVMRNCDSGSDIKLPQLSTITAKRRTIPTFEEPSVVTPKIPKSTPRCCIYDMCQSCDIHNPHNPLVLLHGHSFNQYVDAYRAIEIFDGIEYSLSGENLYFLTGILVSGGNGTPGILGKYAVPVINKPTYYLETYNDVLGLNVEQSKTDNIDTYALRLKESIDYTLYMTGNDKVDVVAHSMGGLVVRRYMQIFGTEHIGTVIIVGTPNNGINDRTYNLCKLFGASAECEDMRAGSLFMNKLNDPSNQPDFTNMYLVIGRGCDTEEVDGDGVVTADSVKIEGFPEDHILYIDRGEEGCSVTNVFHQDLIRMNKYPEVYDFIKEKLDV